MPGGSCTCRCAFSFFFAYLLVENDGKRLDRPVLRPNDPSWVTARASSSSLSCSSLEARLGFCSTTRGEGFGAEALRAEVPVAAGDPAGDMTEGR